MSTSMKPKFFISLLVLIFILLTGCQQTAAPEPSPTPQPSNDLIFTPSELAVAPGSTSSVTVQVTSEADLSQASFDLNQVTEGVSLSFEPASDGKSGELFIELSEANAERSQDLNIKGTDGTHTWLGSLKVTASLTAPVTRFVDSKNGNDANAGTSTKPFKTLSKGLSVSKNGDTVKLKPGTYGALSFGSGDKFPLTVPNGVKIVGTLAPNGAKQSFLATTSGTADDSALVLAGDATVKDLEVDVLIKATKGKQTLTNLNFILNPRSLELHETAQATLSQIYFFLGTGNQGIQVSDEAGFTLDGGTFDYVGDCNGGRAVHAFFDSVFHIKNTKFNAFPYDAFLIQNKASGDISASQFGQVKIACGNDTMIEMGQESRLKLSDVKVFGAPGLARVFLRLLDSATLEADKLTVSNYNTALAAGDLANVTLTSSFFSNNDNGVEGGGAARINVSKSTFFNNNVSFRVNVLKLRDSTVKGGDIGIFANSSLVDLGQPSSPGNNVFADCVTSSVFFDPPKDGQELSAVGNTWNANVQLANAQGKYTFSTIDSFQSNARGVNFWLQGPFDAVIPLKIRMNF